MYMNDIVTATAAKVATISQNLGVMDEKGVVVIRLDKTLVILV
ncbi:hypothetical protein [Streptococcus zalophi]|nr:hypothetical protein [Streptococcus zalophi]